MQLATRLRVRRLVLLAGVVTGIVAAIVVFRSSQPSPNAITIVRGSTGCFWSGPTDRFEVTPDGAVTWHLLQTRGYPVRTFQLSSNQLFELHRANELADDDMEPLQATGYSWLRVDGGPAFEVRSSRGEALDDVLTRAVGAYEARRALGDADSEP